MATCKDCAFNGLGWCHMYNVNIPADKLSATHDCEHYNDDDLDADQILATKMVQHPKDAAILWTIQDGIVGNVSPPAGWVAAGWRHLWTAPYFTLAERVAITRSIIPF